MAGSEIALDTNAVIAYFENDPRVREVLRGFQRAVMPTIVYGELYFGVLKSARIEENKRRLENLASACRMLGTDRETARVYAEMKFDLRMRGRPIPENDLWIAALASQHGLPLLTSDEHFGEVKGLQALKW